jgi:hypothetical protein
MYGDFKVSLDENGMRWEVGGNGRLFVREPDGSVRGFHAYLSAVCVIQTTLRGDAVIIKRLNAADANSNLLGIVGSALAANDSIAGDVTVTRLDVFETVSDSAVRLQRDIFNGPYDTRWGITGPGVYGRLAS